MSLKAELDAFRDDFIAKAPAEIRETMGRADMELAASGILDRGLKAGDKCPRSACQTLAAASCDLMICWQKVLSC
jgi:hypothetical protein